MKDGLLQNLSLRIFPPVIALVLRFWFVTCRIKVHGGEHCRSTLDAKRPVIITFWHYSLLGVFPLLRKYSGAVMVSSSKDGEYIARFLEYLGFKTVRGSRNKQGAQALKDLIRLAKTGENTAIVADGSQGPPRVAQPGSILLASRTGIPILPMAWSASRYLSIRSWDKTSLPRPFSTVDFIYGEPFHVPSGLKSEGIEEYRLDLEERLNDLYLKMWKIHGRDEH
jgi:lysophospholipid acyltransferase (LPLAT)-like uncharacterized protein